MEEKLASLEQVLGYEFKNKSLLRCALIHRSYAYEAQVESNERLEFLGDAVLELVVRDYLFHKYPDLNEGRLSQFKAFLVEEGTLAEVARFLELGKYLYLGKGEIQAHGEEKTSILADALEAIIGAIYLDSDFLTALQVVKQIFLPWLDKIKFNANGDYKTLLQNWLQRDYHTLPRYRILKTSGPDHNKQFKVGVFVNNELWGQGIGRSRKAAEQAAAKEALKRLKND
ncbi:MAG: ribonuclease III [Candidatus Desulfofervidaceae bacterium]|nr:ribonuclease III [Candidatus Desulfofervidaceae bacterium]